MQQVHITTRWCNIDLNWVSRLQLGHELLTVWSPVSTNYILSLNACSKQLPQFLVRTARCDDIQVWNPAKRPAKQRTEGLFAYSPEEETQVRLLENPIPHMYAHGVHR